MATAGAVERLAGAGQVGAVADDPGVGLRAEAEPDGLVLVLDDESGGSGGQADGVAQQVGGVGGGRGLVVLAGGVQADDGVEVDDAACLVLGDLDEPDAELGAQRLLGHPGQPGQAAGQVGGEPAPQVGRVGVEQHRGLVVVAVAAHGLAEAGVGLDVAGRAGDVAAVRAAACLGVAAGTAGQDGLAAHPPGVDRAERRRGEGGEHARVPGDRLGDALAAGETGADELAGVALVDGRAGRADGLAAVAARDGRPGRRGGRVRRWRCRSCRCGSGAGSGASRCSRRRAGLPRPGSRARAAGCRRRSPRVPSP